MKSWRRTLAIGFIIAITSQLYWNVFVNNFRVSASVILLPVLIMTVGSQIHTMTICTVTSIIVFLFRIVIYYLQGMPSEMLVQLAMPGAFFYIVYGMMFKLQIRNKHIANLENVIAAAFFCDLCSNIFENFLAALLKNNAMPGPDIIQKLFMIAAVRTLFVALALIGEQQYRLLLTKADHESRYQRLFLMTTGLKTEIYLMHKNTEEIERVMSNAYKLYEQILEKDLPREMQQMGLEIARDVHEIKKDYIRIIQGIEEAIEEESNEETMSLQDLLRILESSTYRTMAEKKLDIRLMFDCRDNFMTQEHYQLMTILKNLVGNAGEAIESTKKSGMIWIREYKKDGNYVFEVADDGPGISEKHLPRIFNMGYSTKFDEKTGNIYRGVGLCGVKNAVEEQFEGSISVDSEEGRGTKFHIEIPIAKLEEIE